MLYQCAVIPSIFKMAQSLFLQVVDAVGDLTKCNHVVDIGAGQGHLSRILHFGYGYNVTTVEASGCHAPKAQKYDAEVQKNIVKGQSTKVRLFPCCTFCFNRKTSKWGKCILMFCMI